MADRDKWGENVLREYKAKPWIHRQLSHHDDAASFALVQIEIRKEMRHLDDYQLEVLRFALAKFLDTDPGAISVIAQRRGSVNLILERPSDAAVELMKKFPRKRAALQRRLPIFPIKDIQAVLSGEATTDLIKGSPAEEELLELVRRTIEGLPSQERLLIHLDLIQRLSADEIRARLGIPSQSDFQKLKLQSLTSLRRALQATLESAGGL